jgi:hypothetical protein
MIDPFVLSLSLSIIDVLAISANVLAAFLVCTETMSDLRDYTNVLVLNCVIDLTCALINTFSRSVRGL